MNSGAGTDPQPVDLPVRAEIYSLDAERIARARSAVLVPTISAAPLITAPPPPAGFSAPLSDSAENTLLTGVLAETAVLLDFLSGRPGGLDSRADAVKSLALRQQQSGPNWSLAREIDADLENPTALVRRIWAIKKSVDTGQPSDDWASDAAFLLLAKAVLNERASPATSLTIAFTRMVVNATVRNWLYAFVQSTGKQKKFVASASELAELAFPNLRREARRLAIQIRYVVPWAIVLFTIGTMWTMTAAVTGVPSQSSYHWLAKATFSTGVLPGFLGLLGSLASIQRRVHQLASAYLLDPGQTRKNIVDASLGLIAGSGVGLLGGSLAVDQPSFALSIFAAAFLAGYSTELVFSLLDVLIVRISRSELLQTRPPRVNTLLKTQSAIASVVTEIHDQIEQFQGNVTLDSFDGAVIVRVRRSTGDPVLIGEYMAPVGLGEFQETIKVTGALLSAGQPYELSVTLDRQPTTAADAVLERLTTGNGTLPASVTFEINLNARGIVFIPNRQEVTLERRSRSAGFVSSFRAPSLPGRYDIFAEISQKKRLVQVALLPVLIENITP